VSSGVLDAEIPTYFSGEMVVDFPVTWDRRPFVLRRIVPPGMAAPFSKKLATA